MSTTFHYLLRVTSVGGHCPYSAIIRERKIPFSLLGRWAVRTVTFLRPPWCWALLWLGIYLSFSLKLPLPAWPFSVASVFKSTKRSIQALALPRCSAQAAGPHGRGSQSTLICGLVLPVPAAHLLAPGFPSLTDALSLACLLLIYLPSTGHWLAQSWCLCLVCS